MLGFAFILKTVKKFADLDLNWFEWTPLNIILLYVFIGTASLGVLAKRAFGGKKKELNKTARSYFPNEMEKMIGKLVVEDALKDLFLDVESINCNILREKEEEIKLRIVICTLKSKSDIIMITADLSCSIDFNVSLNKLKIRASSLNTFSYDCQDPKSSIISEIQTSLSKINSEITLATEFSSSCQESRMKAFYLVLSTVKFPRSSAGLEIKVGKTKLGPFNQLQIQDGQIFKFKNPENSFCEIEIYNFKSLKIAIENGKDDFSDENLGFQFEIKKFLIIGKDKITEFEELL